MDPILQGSIFPPAAKIDTFQSAAAVHSRIKDSMSPRASNVLTDDHRRIATVYAAGLIVREIRDVAEACTI
jgi:hypothetical protein